MTKYKHSTPVRLFWRLHRWIYKLTDGRIGSRLFGHDVLKLKMTGHRSGKPREILIYYFRFGVSYVIVGSNVGADWHPAWVLNLQKQPLAEVQIDQTRKVVRARTATGAERQRLWSQIVEEDKNYQSYQENTDREFPLVVLEPVEDGNK